MLAIFVFSWLPRRLFHTEANIKLFDNRVEIKQKGENRMINFSDVLDVVQTKRTSRVQGTSDQHRTPTISIMFSDGKSYDLRAEFYWFFGNRDEFNAFWKDLKTRHSLFKGTPMSDN